MTRPLRVLARPEESPPHYLVSFLAPFAAPGTAYQQSLLGDWAVAATEQVELTSHDPDVAVLPFGLEAWHEHPELWDLALERADEALRRGIPLLVFCHGDRPLAAPGEACVMLRTSLTRAGTTDRDVPLPAWVADPATLLPPTLRPHRNPPVVAFTGQAFPLGQAFPSRRLAARKALTFGIKSAATLAGVENLLRVPVADPVRPLAVHALRTSRDVEARVTVRAAMTRLDLDRDDDRQAQREMLRGIADADYGLAVRGLGNYSYRLYEVLASGRVPVLVDTGMPLPRARAPQWRNALLPVPLRALPRLGQRIARHHADTTEEAWRQAQQQARDLWVSQLSVPGFFGQLVTELTSLVAAGRPEGLSPQRVAAALR